MFRVCLSVVALCVVSSIAWSQDGDPNASAQEIGYGVISADKVRLRGGPGDSFAEIMRKNRGDLIQIVGRKGDWVEVHVPGGFAAYVKKGSATQPYVEAKTPGEGLVLVDRLMLRPQPTTDYVPIGALRPNQKLILLTEEKGEWYRVLAPDSETLFVYHTFVKLGDDQGALKSDFTRLAVVGRQKILADGALSRKAVKRWAEIKKWEKRFAAADKNLQETSTANPDVVSLKTLRGEYIAIIAGAPKGCEVIARAEGRKTQLDRKLELSTVLEKANARIKQLEEQSKQTDSDYEKALASYRAQADSRPKTPRSRFLEYGIGHLRKDILTEFKDQTVYTLTKGGNRLHFLVSDRYDLDHYLNKTIGVVESEVIADDGVGPRTMRVTRIEIL